MHHQWVLRITNPQLGYAGLQIRHNKRLNYAGLQIQRDGGLAGRESRHRALKRLNDT